MIESGAGGAGKEGKEKLRSIVALFHALLPLIHVFWTSKVMRRLQCDKRKVSFDTRILKDCCSALTKVTQLCLDSIEEYMTQ